MSIDLSKKYQEIIINIDNNINIDYNIIKIDNVLLGVINE